MSEVRPLLRTDSRFNIHDLYDKYLNVFRALYTMGDWPMRIESVNARLSPSRCEEQAGHYSARSLVLSISVA